MIKLVSELTEAIVVQLDSAHCTALVSTAFEVRESDEYLALVAAAEKLNRKKIADLVRFSNSVGHSMAVSQASGESPR